MGGAMADRWDRIKSVFLNLVGRKPSVRLALLADTRIGDEDLRQEVESLLVADERTTQFSEPPGFDVIDRPTQDKRQMIITWVRDALELVAPARRASLQSIYASSRRTVVRGGDAPVNRDALHDQ